MKNAHRQQSTEVPTFLRRSHSCGPEVKAGNDPTPGGSLSPWFDCLQFQPQVHVPLATAADACSLRFHRWMIRKIGTRREAEDGGRGGLARGPARAGQVSSEEVHSSAENRKRKDGETV